MDSVSPAGEDDGTPSQLTEHSVRSNPVDYKRAPENWGMMVIKWQEVLNLFVRDNKVLATPSWHDYLTRAATTPGKITPCLTSKEREVLRFLFLKCSRGII